MSNQHKMIYAKITRSDVEDGADPNTKLPDPEFFREHYFKTLYVFPVDPKHYYCDGICNLFDTGAVCIGWVIGYRQFDWCGGADGYDGPEGAVRLAQEIARLNGVELREEP